MFLKSAHQGCIYLIKNTVKTLILWNTIYNSWFLFECIVKCNLFLWCKAEFSASLLQSSVSHDPSNMLLKKHFRLLSMLKTVVLLHIFVETLMHFCQDYSWSEYENEVCNCENIFFEINPLSTVTFDQFNTSLLKVFISKTTIYYEQYNNIQYFCGNSVFSIFWWI